MRLIIPSALVPTDCQEAVAEACELLWASPAAAANALRRAVESFLDNQNVPKTKIVVKDGKPKDLRLNLDSRLNEFAAAHSDKTWLSDLLQPIRIIGNAGSHSWQPYMRVPLVECFILIDYVLDQFYNNRDERLEHLKSVGAGIRKSKGHPDVDI